MRRKWLVRAAAAVAAFGFGAAGCASPPEPGEWGVFRYMGEVPGDAPLTLLPPANDRDGDLYAAWGAVDSGNVEAFTGRVDGGWVNGCRATKGDTYGLHGWVGHDQGRRWYWSGDALVALAGDGGCDLVLDFDPAGATSLAFRAVIPFVRVTPSRTTLVAWIQSPSDPVPYQTVIDLNGNVYGDTIQFSPKGATDLVVLGVGADPEGEGGVVLVRYTYKDAVKVEARFMDGNAKTTAKVALSGLENEPELGVQGYLQASDDKLYAGLLSTGEVLVLDPSGGRRKKPGGIAPVGVHRWEGKLWLVGTAKGKPVVAAIDGDGAIGRAQTWKASVAAAEALHGDIDVRDDRRLPADTVTWKSPKTAMGEFPFLSPHTLAAYADGTTLWAIAGPKFSFGGESRTSVAVAPVGVTYP